MEMTTYLSFKGDCEAAFALYERCLGARVGSLFRYGGSPMADRAPADWQDKIMHGSVTIGHQVLMGAAVVPAEYHEPRGVSLSLQLPGTSEAERVFGCLAEGGQVLMPLQQTFWAPRFGTLVDRFGVPWQINCEGTGEPV